jgi:hypothetical protein
VLLIQQCRWLANPIVPATKSFSVFRCTSLHYCMPCIGQCLNLGRSSKDKDCRYCGAAGTYRSISIGTLHANCRKLCAHAKPVGEVGVRYTWSQLSPSSYGSSHPHLIRRSSQTLGISPSELQLTRGARCRFETSGVQTQGFRERTSTVGCLTFGEHRIETLLQTVLQVCSFRARPTEVTASPLSGADVIRSNGFGSKW